MALNCHPHSAVTNDERTTTPAIVRRCGDPRTRRRLPRGSPVAPPPPAARRPPRLRPATPERAHEGQGREQEGGHQDEEAFGAEEAREGVREESPRRPADGGPRGHEAEEALRLAGREHVVGEDPDLGGGEDAEDAHPEVKGGVEPGGGRAVDEKGEGEETTPKRRRLPVSRRSRPQRLPARRYTATARATRRKMDTSTKGRREAAKRPRKSALRAACPTRYAAITRER